MCFVKLVTLIVGASTVSSSNMFSLISQYVEIFILVVDFHHSAQILAFATICLLNAVDGDWRVAPLASYQVE